MVHLGVVAFWFDSWVMDRKLSSTGMMQAMRNTPIVFTEESIQSTVSVFVLE